MERKAVYFLFCIFVFYSGAYRVRIHRIATEMPFNLTCSVRDRNFTHLEWFRFDSSKTDIPCLDNSSNVEVIFRWQEGEENRTIKSKKYENEFYNEKLKQDIRNNISSMTLMFRSAKMWHSGIYWCRYRIGPKLTMCAFMKDHVKIYKQQFKITPCKDNENVQVQCSVFDLDVKPRTTKFYQLYPDQHRKSLNLGIYDNITERAGKYNITGETVVPCNPSSTSNVLEFILTFRSGSDLQISVNLSNQSVITNNVIHCLPHLRMEKHRIWQKVGEENITFRCIFDIPHEDTISKIEWFRNDPLKPHLMYNWTREKGQYVGRNYENETYNSIAPVEYNGRNATTVRLETATLNHTGNYKCKVIFSKHQYRNQSDTAVLVVYQLEKPNFTAVGCTDRKVDLECKASKVYPKPEEMTLSIYNPKSKSLEKINNVSPEIKNESELYDIAVKMTTAIDQRWFGESPNISCEVVLRREFEIKETSWTKRKTYVTDSKGIRTDVCFPKVEMDRPPKWLKVGKTPVFQCKFDIPLHDEIESIVWIHRNISDENILYKWEKKTNESTITDRWKNEIVHESSLIHNASGDKLATTLKLKNATFDYNGNYSCRVDFVFAGNFSDTAMLVIYEIEKPYFFEATIHGKFEVRLECKAGHIFPRPLGIAFYKYDPVRNLKTKLDNEILTEIIPVGEFFNISAKMNIEVYESESVEYMCDVVLSEDLVILETKSTAPVASRDISDAASTTGKAQISTEVIIGSSVVGALLLAALLACLAYVCDVKHHFCACFRNMKKKMMKERK